MCVAGVEEAGGEATKEPETPRTSQSHRSRYVVAKGSEDISPIDGGNEWPGVW